MPEPAELLAEYIRALPEFTVATSMDKPTISTPDIHVKRITASTVRQICKLSQALTPPQRKMVAHNAVSIAQAHFSDNAWLRAIYGGDTSRTGEHRKRRSK